MHFVLINSLNSFPSLIFLAPIFTHTLLSCYMCSTVLPAHLPRSLCSHYHVDPALVSWPLPHSPPHKHSGIENKILDHTWDRTRSIHFSELGLPQRMWYISCKFHFPHPCVICWELSRLRVFPCCCETWWTQMCRYHFVGSTVSCCRWPMW